MLAEILGYYAKSPTKIAGLQVDIVRQVDYVYEQEAPEHPVESGFEVHDTIINKPLRVNMTVGISSHPVTWLYKNGKGNSKFENGYLALVGIRDAKEPVTIIRPDRLLKDMVMTSCKLGRTDESKSVMFVDLSFVQIRKVSLQNVSIPEDIVDKSIKDSAGETAKNGGAAGQNASDAKTQDGANGVKEEVGASIGSNILVLGGA